MGPREIRLSNLDLHFRQLGELFVEFLLLLKVDTIANWVLNLQRKYSYFEWYVVENNNNYDDMLNYN